MSSEGSSNQKGSLAFVSWSQEWTRCIWNIWKKLALLSMLCYCMMKKEHCNQLHALMRNGAVSPHPSSLQKRSACSDLFIPWIIHWHFLSSLQQCVSQLLLLYSIWNKLLEAEGRALLAATSHDEWLKLSEVTQRCNCLASKGSYNRNECASSL